MTAKPECNSGLGRDQPRRFLLLQPVKLGNLVRYTYEDVKLWLARQLELSRG